MVTFVGHGIYEEYSCEIPINGNRTLESMLRQLDISDELFSVILLVKDTKVISLDYEVKDKDVIHLYILHDGG